MGGMYSYMPPATGGSGQDNSVFSHILKRLRLSMTSPLVIEAGEELPVKWNALHYISGYNYRTGVWTCPNDGSYLIDMQIALFNLSTDINAFVTISGLDINRDIGLTYTMLNNPTRTNLLQIPVHKTLELIEGDEIQVKIRNFGQDKFAFYSERKSNWFNITRLA
jgi:hypothetical protein